jgi:cyclophilin family peptidyl-prolyl cis-trans isomerase
VSNQYSAPPAMAIDAAKKYQAIMATNKGVITFDLFPGETPNTVNSFVFLSREGFYNGVIFHRIISGFMLQGGDPTGTGTGGPGYKFADEKFTRDYIPGTLAMANSGPNTNGSQFFIMHGNVALPKQYTIFGQATDGLDVVNAIAATPTTMSPSGEQSTPTEEIRIESVEITETD